VNKIVFQPIETQEEEMRRVDEQERIEFLKSLREQGKATGETEVQTGGKKLFVPRWAVFK